MTTKTKKESDASATTVADVDEGYLQQAQELLGTSSPRDTVNESLREVVRRRMVSEYLELRASNTTTAREVREQAWR